MPQRRAMRKYLLSLSLCKVICIKIVVSWKARNIIEYKTKLFKCSHREAVTWHFWMFMPAKTVYSSNKHLLSICCVLSILVPMNTYPCEKYVNKYWQWSTVLAIKEVYTRCNGITEKLAFMFAQSNWKRCHWIFGLNTYFCSMTF